MRYIVTDDREVTLRLLESEQEIDSYRIERDADDGLKEPPQRPRGRRGCTELKLHQFPGRTVR